MKCKYRGDGKEWPVNVCGFLCEGRLTYGNIYCSSPLSRVCMAERYLKNCLKRLLEERNK